jgi:hypothetical protein
MMRGFGGRIACLVLLAAVVASAGAEAQWRDGRQEQFASQCRPPLKFAAGACVRSCPGGFEDRGRVCVFRSQSSGNGGQ